MKNYINIEIVYKIYIYYIYINNLPLKLIRSRFHVHTCVRYIIFVVKWLIVHAMFYVDSFYIVFIYLFIFCVTNTTKTYLCNDDIVLCFFVI